MLIDVGDPVRNVILNLSFALVMLIALLALVPWRIFGAHRLGRMAIWLPVPALATALAYEAAMPSRYDIRLDLVLLVPAYALVLFATLIRLIAIWRGHQRRSDKRAV